MHTYQRHMNHFVYIYYYTGLSFVDDLYKPVYFLDVVLLLSVGDMSEKNYEQLNIVCIYSSGMQLFGRLITFSTHFALCYKKI